MSNYCRILIIDDEFIMRQGIKHMIDWEAEGFQIVGEAANGEQALKLIDSFNPHIIISDIVMPGLNGVDFAKIVQEKYPSIQILILSSYNDFDYVKSTLLSGAIDYILKPTLNPDELIKTLKKAAAKISDFTMVSDSTLHPGSLISRYILGFQSTLDTAAFQEVFPHSAYLLFGIHIKQIFGKNKEKYQLYLKLFIEWKNTLLSEYACETASINDEVLFLAVNYPPQYQSTLFHQIRKAADSALFLEAKTFLCLSRPFYHLSEIKTVYKNYFLPLTMRRFFHRDVSLLTDTEKSSPPDIPKFEFKQFARLISTRQYPLALSMLQDYVTLITGEYQMEEYELKSLLKNSFYQILLSMEDMGINTDHLKQDSFLQVDESEYADELRNRLEHMILTFHNLLEENQSSTSSHMIARILTYIEENYAQPLDLAEVASQFGFNYHYLSSYFSSHNEEGFSEYLTKIRTEKAKELLRKNQLSIYEISGAVGYSDHSYFCRVFKKAVGCTPSSYRKKNSDLF